MGILNPLTECATVSPERVGHKARNLGILAEAGLPVPSGLVVPIAALTVAGQQAVSLRAEARDELLNAYRTLGGGPVAVRSSGTGEDSAEASFAGQHLTLLNVAGEAELLTAVERCAASGASEEAEAYRRARQGGGTSAGVAVIVQAMVRAECAGVVFTANPVSGASDELVIEAISGLGDRLVSGEVTPERFTVSRAEVLSASSRPPPQPRLEGRGAGHGPEARAYSVAPVLRAARSLRQNSRAPGGLLSAEELAELGRLALQIEELFGRPQDIEWARAGGSWHILQARPVTTGVAGCDAGAALREREIARLQAAADPAGTVWSAHNLAETLPFPTPMTWSILRCFLSGHGGLGAAYRALGYRPDPALDEVGIFDIICGRPYCNLSREALLYFRGFPFEHPFAEIKAAPTEASYSRPAVNARGAGWGFLARLPLFCWWTMAAELKQQWRLRGVAGQLCVETFPAFAAWARGEQKRDLALLTEAALLECLDDRISRTFDRLGRDALEGALLAGKALAALEAYLRKVAPDALCDLPSVLSGCPEGPNTGLQRALGEVARGARSIAEFLVDYGHRAPGEFELGVPRWRETPGDVSRMASGLADPTAGGSGGGLRSHEQRRSDFLDRLPSSCRRRVSRLLATALVVIPLRELGKFYLMMGHELIRLVLIEAGRRTGLEQNMFLLQLDEIGPALRGGAFGAVVATRRAERQALREIWLPPVIFSDDLQAIGRPSPPLPGRELSGTGVSSGIGEGKALVVETAGEVSPAATGYVLVAAAADPGWTPVLVRAGALVLERGGMLSHSAIVAREFGIPAVVNVPDALRRIRTGDRLRVDGRAGTVVRLADETG